MFIFSSSFLYSVKVVCPFSQHQTSLCLSHTVEAPPSQSPAGAPEGPLSERNTSELKGCMMDVYVLALKLKPTMRRGLLRGGESICESYKTSSQWESF